MAYRVFKSPDGRVWSAWDVPAASASESSARFSKDERLVHGWLCFECGAEKRRLVPVPARWEERSEEQLWLYCRVAEPAGHAPTPASDQAPDPEVDA